MLFVEGGYEFGCREGEVTFDWLCRNGCGVISENVGSEGRRPGVWLEGNTVPSGVPDGD